MMADFKAVLKRRKHKKVAGQSVSEWCSFGQFGQHVSIFFQFPSQSQRFDAAVSAHSDGASHCRLIVLPDDPSYEAAHPLHSHHDPDNPSTVLAPRQWPGSFLPAPRSFARECRDLHDGRM